MWGGQIVAASRYTDPNDRFDPRFRQTVAKWIGITGCVDLPTKAYQRAFEGVCRAVEKDKYEDQALIFAHDGKEIRDVRELKEKLDQMLKQVGVHAPLRILENALEEVLTIRGDRQRALQYIFEEFCIAYLGEVDKEKMGIFSKINKFARETIRPGMEPRFTGSAVEKGFARLKGEEEVN